MKKIFLVFWALFVHLLLYAQENINDYDIVWDKQSKNSAESMPCGGGDIGLNVWVENNDIFFYISRSGTFDENNAMLKLGRVRLNLFPNPFVDGTFSQKLDLKTGSIEIAGKGTKVLLWVDVFNPIIYVDITSKNPTKLSATYESWRYKDFVPIPQEFHSNSYGRPTKMYKDVKTYKDKFEVANNTLIFYHRNRCDIPDIFDVSVDFQGLSTWKDEMYNPLHNLTFGGYMSGDNLSYEGKTSGTYMHTNFEGWRYISKKNTCEHQLSIGLHVAQTDSEDIWKDELYSIKKSSLGKSKEARKKTIAWWKDFWNRSYIYIKGSESDLKWQVARNYQLFRYQLGCNAYGKWPTKFNGGLFTYDPENIEGTPDFRLWGGGTMTAQNQRLLYWPMLKSGDFDMMQSQFNFYQNSLWNAELRSKVYWGHKGASFTEQIDNTGLPSMAHYGYDRPQDFDKGVDYNDYLEHEWETVLEFCMMMLERERYEGKNISEYIPFIESCLTFYDEHFQYHARKRGRQIFDENGCYVFYPSSACETYKMTYNSTTVISALKSLLERMQELPDTILSVQQKVHWGEMLKRIPPIPLRVIEGHTMLAPAETWQRVQNLEAPQLYPVFPWRLYGIGRPNLDIARNTYLFDPHVVKYKDVLSWKQYAIFAACLGLTDEAAKLTIDKLKDSERRFPTFWGPGYDWIPDHNWGGSGMCGLQEMLLQADGRKLYLLPAWPKDWDVDFKLHAPYKTTIECKVRDGKIQSLIVTPKNRLKDIVYVGTFYE